MKVGILLCGYVDDDLRELYGEMPAMFTALLSNVDPTLDFVNYAIPSGEFPEDIDECDAYLITGSKHSAYDDFDWIESLEQFIRDLHYRQKKLMGICFGHQIIAQALGGKVVKAERGWGVGVYRNQIVAHTDYLKPSKKDLALLAIHQDQVIEPPQGSKTLASSEFCPIYMLSIGSHIFSVQGHPEFSKGFVRVLLDSRTDLIGEDTLQKGYATLSQPTDSVEFADWIVKFFKS